ncbi:MAG: OsmC family protein [Rhodospirillaceae bacterium]|nr:OsmC family protein [Rhodospirillaceae bacterium]
MAEASTLVAKTKASIGTTDYAVSIQAGHHALVADEHAALGGKDAGPAPFALLLSGLGACTAITLRMYAKRKEWPLEAVDVDLRYLKTGDAARIERFLTLKGPLTDEQKVRFADIAERTPVTLAIKGGVPIKTELR